MRFPRASAVIVALSTFVAVVTVAALASQLSPLDRAGAVLPEGAITIEAPEAEAPEADAPDDTPAAGETPPSGTSPAPGVTTPGSTGGAPSADNATVVVPAPAETIEPEPEPSGPPTNPGNSGNAPGHSERPDDGSQGKP